VGAIFLTASLAVGLLALPAGREPFALSPALPRHFSFGVHNALGSVGHLNAMRDQNGTAWDFRYQYLSGGVNTGHDWTTWTSQPGQFARAYLQESWQNGYIPVFVYYELLQSEGSCGRCDESKRDLSNLTDPRLMGAYFENWTLLMQQIGNYGRPAVVIVEPDLWGYIEQAAVPRGNTAAAIAASVARSGNAEVAGLPDTAQGFAWALLRIRDRYAPSALLALHSSPFGTGVDVASSGDPLLDATAVGRREAQFLNTAGLVGNPPGLSSFDLLSSDVANQDSGQSGIWWDRQNVAFPNFTRYLEFVAAVSSGTGRRVVMWQVPIGNQYFRSLDNGPGHTQDNRAEYVLQHVRDFAEAGLIGVLFGSGSGGTEGGDVMRDGVNNPEPIRTFQCDLCNSHVSKYPDDDGGYLRTFVGAYYAAGAYALPLGLPVVSGGAAIAGDESCARDVTFGEAQASPASVAAGTTVTFSVALAARCKTSALVDFEVYSAGGQRVWQSWENHQVLSSESRSLESIWRVPEALVTGVYTLKVGVFRPGWGDLYGWNDDALRLLVTGGAKGCAGAPQIGFGKTSAVPVSTARGTAVAFAVSLTASCPINVLVDFEVYSADGERVWQGWLDNQILDATPRRFDTSWSVPADLVNGDYTLKVGVFRAGWRAIYGWDNSAATVPLTR
jgi:hypothetical protein